MQAELAVLAQRVEAMREDFGEMHQALLDAAVCSADQWWVAAARLGMRPLDSQEGR